MAKTTPGPTTVQRKTLSGLVVEQVREAILSGAYGLGAPLNEVEIARQCGVSRGPVREAMQRLAQEGLVTSTPHRGVSVPDLTDEDLRDVFFARYAIEGAAIRAVISAGKQKQTGEELRAILSLMGASEKEQDWPRVAELDMDLHSHIVAAAESARLQRMYRVLVAEMKLCFRLLLGGYRGREGIVESHEQLIELIARGQTEKAIDELAAHLDEPLQSLRAARKAMTDQNA